MSNTVPKECWYARDTKARSAYTKKKKNERKKEKKRACKGSKRKSTRATSASVDRIAPCTRVVNRAPRRNCYYFRGEGSTRLCSTGSPYFHTKPWEFCNNRQIYHYPWPTAKHWQREAEKKKGRGYPSKGSGINWRVSILWIEAATTASR